MNRLCLLGVVFVLFVADACGEEASARRTSCLTIAKLVLPNTRIVKAEEVQAGKFPPRPPMYGEDTSIYRRLPAFCRVNAIIAPSTDSAIEIEVWMPSIGWNGKFRGAGNGGFAGYIDYFSLARAVDLGYAGGSTDTGNKGGGEDASWALGHPEKVIDFGYRGIHEMTLKSKSIVEAYYKTSPKHSYFESCSNGGRQGLMEAQRFPEDYDGILVGAAGNEWTRALTSEMFNGQILTIDPAKYIPATKLPTIAAAVLASCDNIDGISDGILNDPRECHFDPVSIQCKGIETSKCLTGPQVNALKELYAGAKDSSGKLIYPGYLPGGEEGTRGWASSIMGPSLEKNPLLEDGRDYFSNFVFANAKWDYKTFTVDEGLHMAVEKTGSVLDAANPNLKPFATRGGKLILWHGWSDSVVPPLSTIDYFNQVNIANHEPDAHSFVRLFMAPGVQHCGSGPGPDSFGWQPASDDPQHDLYLALEQWVENGRPPEKVIATKYDNGPAKHVIMTRPLCAYPRVAKYKGSGDTSNAANFSCDYQVK